MGMFDDIRVPLSNFKGIVSEQQFAILKYANKKDSFFQTKCLDCNSSTYKINRKKLYKQKGKKLHFERISDTISIYNSIKHSDGHRYWLEFNVRIIDGVVEDIRLHDFEVETEQELIDKENEFKIVEKIKKSFRYKFFTFLGKRLYKLSIMMHNMSGLKVFQGRNLDEI